MDKFCSNCGAKLKEGGDICLKCGKFVNGTIESTNTTSTVPANTKTNGLAIAGFIVSLSSLLINFWGIVGAVGTILSCFGLAQLKQRNEKGFGMALTGIIIGSSSIIFGLFQIATFIMYFS